MLEKSDQIDLLVENVHIESYQLFIFNSHLLCLFKRRSAKKPNIFMDIGRGQFSFFDFKYPARKSIHFYRKIQIFSIWNPTKKILA